jgi:hypothetical protein
MANQLRINDWRRPTSLLIDIVCGSVEYVVGAGRAMRQVLALRVLMQVKASVVVLYSALSVPGFYRTEGRCAPARPGSARDKQERGRWGMLKVQWPEMRYRPIEKRSSSGATVLGGPVRAPSLSGRGEDGVAPVLAELGVF